LTAPGGSQRLRKADLKAGIPTPADNVEIILNGEPYTIDQPLTVVALLERLDIDSRRVAVEHNLAIVKRHRFPDVVIGDGDQVEIVNFVGGG
jgi:sulfur carrier protein